MAIHNTVNERCWQHILEWESKRVALPQEVPIEPQLIRFEGRPNDLSPKARMLGLIGWPMLQMVADRSNDLCAGIRDLSTDMTG